VAKARSDSNGHRPLSETAYRSLRQAIFAGRYQPGDRLLEGELAASLGISRTPLREALQRLEAEGLLTAAPRRGLVVTELERDEVAMLYAVREVLEGLAGRMAAQHASSAELDAMRELLDRQTRVSKQDAEAIPGLNKQFRDLVHHATRNRFLISALETLEIPVAALPSPAFAISGQGAAAHRDHADLLKALERRDADRAAELSATHMRAMARQQILLLSGEVREDAPVRGSGDGARRKSVRPATRARRAARK
jgi:DNA-binding GntR family transcriptional regulator